MKLLEGFDSNYRYILVAARRARQIQSGAKPMIEVQARKPCRIAMAELNSGRVKWYIPQPEKSAKAVADELLEKAMATK